MLCWFTDFGSANTIIGIYCCNLARWYWCI